MEYLAFKNLSENDKLYEIYLKIIKKMEENNGKIKNIDIVDMFVKDSNLIHWSLTLKIFKDMHIFFKYDSMSELEHHYEFTNEFKIWLANNGYEKLFTYIQCYKYVLNDDISINKLKEDLNVDIYTARILYKKWKNNE